MKESTYEERFARYYMRDMEQSQDQEGIQLFFQLQEELMDHITRSHALEAQKTMKKLQVILRKRAPEAIETALPRFYLTQVALFANELQKFGISPVKIFCFSSASIELIYSWNTEKEMVEGGRWLVESFIDMISERLNPLFSHPIVSQAAEYINHHLEEPIEVDAVAKEIGISPSYLAKLFKQEAGMTVKQFSNHRKVVEAKYYLQFSNKEIAQIADQFSFCNQSYFTKVFKDQMGLTPKQFRLSLQEAKKSYQESS
ncbi:helix-turn-helix transcriptional regulator [Jeotgalibacillus proteolyticus]|uniref:helix-turn-helix transcriptional regulator n=1 Tax=Jeotgalibacillus proteolyticus TaxID=2082395 RepID=UPI003CEF95AA